jgi:hypothetical protein
MRNPDTWLKYTRTNRSGNPFPVTVFANTKRTRHQNRDENIKLKMEIP